MSDEVSQLVLTGSITINYEPTPQNLLNAFRVYDKKHGLSWMMLLKRAVIYLPASAILAWLMKKAWVFAVFVTVFYVLHFYEYRRYRRRQVKKLFDDKGFGGPCVLTFKEDGMDTSGPLGESKLNWNFAAEMVETPGELVLFGNGGQVIPIPKNAFQDDNQLAAVRALLQRKANGVDTDNLG